MNKVKITQVEEKYDDNNQKLKYTLHINICSDTLVHTQRFFLDIVLSHHIGKRNFYSAVLAAEQNLFDFK